MNHIIRIAYGDSESIINRLNENLLYQGILQGNRYGPFYGELPVY